MRKLTQEEYNEIINKQLEKHGVKVEDIGHEEGWYSKYTLTTDEYEEWKKWTVQYIRDKCKISKKWAEREFPWISLQHGLRVDDGQISQ